MLRTTITKAPLRAPAAFASRAFSTTARTMAEGDTGSPRPTGGPGDAWQRREKGAEDYAIREREKEKLQELRRKLDEQQSHLKKLSDHIDEITKNQGGEQN